MIIQAELRRKQSEYEGESCAVDKVIALPSQRFQQFSRALLADYDFIAENKNAIRHDDDARHCLLILDAEGMDGFLVDPQGYNYARYSAFIPNARSLLTPDMPFDRSYLSPAEPWRDESRDEMLRMTLRVEGKPDYTLVLPADEEYEDAEYHNAVFVGTDTDGVPRHAHKRSANSYGKAFRLNVEGSDPRYSFHHVGTDRSLYVFEAPIDMLSFITLYPENWQRHSYVACCGTSIQPVLQMLEQVPQLDTVLLCLDNDEAGHQASRRMQNQLEVRYSVERLIPENKDWNDDLTLNSENAQGLAMNEMR